MAIRKLMRKKSENNRNASAEAEKKQKAADAAKKQKAAEAKKKKAEAAKAE